jgi:hypothetical protein
MSFITESKKIYRQVEALEKENSDHEISMARSELESTADKALAISSMLQDKSDTGNPLEAWVQSKITKAKDYITSVHDYLKYTPGMNESFDLEENTFEKIYQMQQDGKSSEDIAKELKLNPALVKKVLGEQVELQEFTDAQIVQLKKEYDPLKGKTITTAQYQQLKNILFKLQDGDLEKLQKQNIPFASTGAGSILRVRKAPVKITSVKVPGLEGMAEEKIPQGYLDYLRTIVYKKVDFYEIPPKHIIQHWRDEPNKDRFTGKIIDYKEEVDMSKVTKYKMISIKGDQKEITIDRKDLEKHLKLGYVIKEPLTEETTFWWHDGKTGYVKAGYDNKELVAWLKKNGYKPEKKEEVEVKEQTELKPVPSLEDSAKKHKVDVEVLKKQLEKGIQVEKEHTKDEKTAEKIALAHIDERPDYYDQLAKVEKQPVDEACWTGYKKVGMKKKGDRMVPNCVPEGYVTESGDIVEFVELNEGQFKEIDTRKGDLKLAKDKKQNLKDKYNAIMAGQATGDENSIANQIQKLEMSIKKQEQELIDIMKKQRETKKEEVELQEKPSIKQYVVFYSKDSPTKHQDFKAYDETELNKQIGEFLKQNPGYKVYGKSPSQSIKESHFPVNTQVLYKGQKAQIVQLKQPQVGNYYVVKLDSGENVEANHNELKLVENKINEGARALVEAITALQKKADKSGMPYSILKQVYDRGMAAWKGGHRPGASQHQWAFARVNSFVTKSSGTWGGADSDLAKKVKGKE